MSPEAGAQQGSTVGSLSVIIVLVSSSSSVFEWLADTNTGPAEGLSSNAVFFVVFLSCLNDLATVASRTASSLQGLTFHRFANRWMLLTQLMITWHLLTVWRHWAIAPAVQFCSSRNSC